MKNLFMFVAGAAIGSAVTYFLVKDKFEKIAQEEIDSVKEVFGRKVKKEAEKEAEKEIQEIRKEYNQYNSLTTNYASFSNKTDDEAEEELEEKYENQDIIVERATDMDRPYIIPPEEFGICDGYELITLTHYSDGVLADDCDELVEDIDFVVGEDYAEHFGEYEEDAIYVRNDRLKADYEILRDLRKYSDVLWRPPHQF